jgi:NAD+ synthase (glutamine-hydrolysing)
LILEALKGEDSQDSDIMVFPELSISGYGCEDAFYKPFVWEKSFQSLTSILPEVRNRLVVLGLPYFFQSSLYNTIAICHNNSLIGLFAKQNLANTGIHYESRWFRPWIPGSFEETNSGIPIGDFVVELFGDIRVGFEICEDSWVMSKPSHRSISSGADVILSPGASHFALNKQTIRKQLFRESARSGSVVYVYSNLVGNESGRSIFEGGSMIVHPDGKIKELSNLGMNPIQKITDDISISKIRSRKSRELRTSLENELNVLSLDSFEIQSKKKSLSSMVTATWNGHPENSKMESNHFEDFLKAETLSIWDYLRKSGSKGYTISLSGGADSSMCAVLVNLMMRRVQNELKSTIWKETNLDPNDLFYTLYQGTVNNSKETKNLANQLSKELGSKHGDISIDPVVEANRKLIDGFLGKEATWEEQNLALQNIQARVRSPLVWYLANLKNHLLISTGNRSEASVGYTTMDGDSSGSIAPLAGISKKFLLECISFLYSNAFSPYKGSPSLKALLDMKPTAELKPLSEKQEDEKDLMPYPILQSIEEKFVFHGLDHDEIIFDLRKEFPNEPVEKLREWITKFTTLFRRSQWKRERLPPSFHLDEYGLDPKTSYRYPILSGDGTL